MCVLHTSENGISPETDWLSLSCHNGKFERTLDLNYFWKKSRPVEGESTTLRGEPNTAASEHHLKVGISHKIPNFIQMVFATHSSTPDHPEAWCWRVSLRLEETRHLLLLLRAEQQVELAERVLRL